MFKNDVIDFIDDCYCIQILDDEYLVGFALFSIHYIKHNLKSRLFLQRLYTSPKYRGRGLASYLIKILKSLNLDTIFLEVYVDNYNAIQLYKQLGFIIKSCIMDVEKRYYVMSCNTFNK